jgi:hypothetical protein
VIVAVRTLFAWFLVAALPAADLYAQDAPRPPTGRMHGRVLDQRGSRGIAGVAVTLVPGDHHVTTDEGGRFSIQGLEAGSYALRLESAPHGTREDSVTLDRGEAIDVTARLKENSPEQQPIEWFIRSAGLDRLGFYERRYVEPGIFLTEYDIERQRPRRTSDLFHRMAGLIVEVDGPDRRTIRVVRGVSCSPDLLLDGQRLGPVGVDLLRPEEIAGIEVYLGSVAPIRYRTSTCGVILLWSRRNR